MQQADTRSFKTYAFQKKLAENGMNRVNNIVCVRTGAGKTLIAAMICKHWSEKLQREKERQLRAAFIVPTRHLAEQQKNAFEMLFDSDLLATIGENQGSAHIKAASDEKCVIFLTAQKLVNALNENYLTTSHFDILVFDECHHTYDYHPYNMVMHIYFKEKALSDTPSSLPLIIGLTASLGISRNEPNKQILKLCGNLDCQAVSYLNEEDEQDMLKCIRSPLADQVISVEHTRELCFILEATKMAIQKILAKINLQHLESSLGKQEFENKIIDARGLAEVNSDRMRLIGIKYLLELNSFYSCLMDLDMQFCVDQLKEFLSKNEKISEPTDDYCWDIISKLLKYFEDKHSDNIKLLELVKLIQKCHRSNSRGLVLVKTRLYTKSISDYLNNYSGFKVKIKSTTLTGQGSSDDYSMNDSTQKTNLADFRTGRFNVLVATDIAQEGLDIPECNYVIRYEFVSSEIGTVQSRGRARAENGQLYLITENGSKNEDRELENRQREKMMQDALRELDPSLLKQAPIWRQSFTEVTTEQPQRKKFDNASIHCKNCSRKLFELNQLRHRDPNYICVSKEFRKLINEDHSKMMFYCSDPSCHLQLGRHILMKNALPLLMMEIKSIKFNIPGKKKSILSDSFQTYRQWSLAADELEIAKHLL